MLKSDLSLLVELYSRCSILEPSTLEYVEKFISRHEHPLDVGVYDLISHVHKSEGIF